MPPPSRDVISRAILDAIHESGGVGLLMQSTQPHPRMYHISRSGQQSSLWVYCWTLTHGGRESLQYEYRIQMTSVESPLPVNPDGQTILLGYEPDRGVFAGFDLEWHRSFTGRPPSVQVNISTLNDCLQDGLAFQTKRNNEVAIGIRIAGAGAGECQGLPGEQPANVGPDRGEDSQRLRLAVSGGGGRGRWGLGSNSSLSLFSQLS